MAFFALGGAAVGTALGFTQFLWTNSGERLFQDLEHLTPEGYDCVVRLSYFRTHDAEIFAKIAQLTDDMCRLMAKDRELGHPAEAQRIATAVTDELRRLEYVLSQNEEKLIDDEVLKDTQKFFDDAVKNVLLETSAAHGINA
jgi:hypothetical protein